ncbi:uncharacterized protein LOC110115464 [Dendrobium catenatum]|uniref:Uncharacterized protein n=1 Tax=Dendrobium catenatum TaxID=906689 RepID=A0A2I0VR75_9ASPA|nr:uncharacterized protein LOC110115464 [Dendrobium catenatum]PKU65883.1 hypothetical protein MA16_Dca009212 [Dendrobium catenatum]
MEVVMPVQEFHFESATTTPYMSAPSSPKHFGVDPMEFYYPYAGAPTSPTAAEVEDEFAFDFSGHLEKNAQPPALTSADELFDQGKIRPLRPPPRLCSPPHDPFAATVNRGRNSTPYSAFSPSISRSQSPKKSRSLSPLRAGKGSTDHFQTPVSSHPPPIATVSCSCKGGGSDGSWKWLIKDFLLFRSASEGRAIGGSSKDFLRKFTELPSSSSSPPKLKKAGSGDVSRSSSFRSVDSSGSVSRRGSTRRAVSPHARHYTANKAAADEMKKKTALPYRQSFFSCLRFSPALHSLTSRG